MMLYPRLALTGIKKNRQTYTPYILTCSGMIMMYYIVSFLSRSEQMKSLEGGSTMAYLLNMGCGVMIAFSAIFLYYTNSFLIKRRTKEFGLYNILGMGKWNLARILVWECILTTAVSLLGGLLLGILFSKASEMLLTHMLDGQITLAFSVDGLAVFRTTVLFLVIFALILLNNLRQIRMSNPIGLLHGTAEGEKPPKGNLLLAILAAVITFPSNLICSKITRRDISAGIHLIINIVFMVGCIYLYSIFRYDAVWLLIIGIAAHIAATALLFAKSKAPQVSHIKEPLFGTAKMIAEGVICTVLSDCIYYLLFSALLNIFRE